MAKTQRTTRKLPEQDTRRRIHKTTHLYDDEKTKAQHFSKTTFANRKDIPGKNDMGHAEQERVGRIFLNIGEEDKKTNKKNA